MQRDQLPPHKTATFVMQRWQALYVSVNKAACTSLKWLVAELQEEDPARFHRSLSREVTPIMTIHRRHLWRKTPMAKRLPDEKLAEISPEGGWFVFAVVRHPTARLFSAWQSKLLLREPWFVEQYGDEEWFPRDPRTGDDIVEEFQRFVGLVAQNPDQRIMRNRHFAPQDWMLAADRMAYSRIYKTSEISQLLSDFEKHLRARGYSGDPLTLPRANETPLKPVAGLFTPAVLDASRALYAGDFERFGYDDALPGGLDPADSYDDDVVAEIGRLVERQQRINDLALRAQQVQSQARAAIAAARQPAPTPSRVRRLAWRARRRLGAGRAHS
jgi:Sulfotransferase family